MAPSIQPHPTMYDPARYVIRVRGRLQAGWTDHFDEVVVSQWHAGNEVMTELVGTLRDQTALLSVLTSLDDLGLPLLAVGLMPRGKSGFAIHRPPTIARRKRPIAGRSACSMTGPSLSMIFSIFRDLSSAIAVASRIEVVIRSHHVEVDGVAIVAEDDGGKILLHELGKLPIEQGTTRGAILGTVLGLMFPPAHFSSAFLAASIGALVERAAVDDAQSSDLRRIGARLKPCQAALVVVGPEGAINQITETLIGYELMIRRKLSAGFVTAAAART